MAVLDSVNLGSPESNPYKDTRATGIGKHAQPEPVQVRAPGPKSGGLGSGLVGDYIGDTQHHGGDGQAVYAFQREDLDDWSRRLERELPNGFFGENLTTRELEVNQARIGERWRIGADVVLQVTSPRIPCATFRGWVGEKRWLKTFTQAARPGAYLSVVTPGTIRSGDPIEVVRRPDHEVTVALVFRATTIDRALLARPAARRRRPGSGDQSGDRRVPVAGIADGFGALYPDMTVATRLDTIDLRDIGTVHRLGFGAMRITGQGIWGEPADREVARQVVRRAVELGVDFIDTADAYGPDISEQIIAEALHPYPEGIRVATKVGNTRTGPNEWIPVGRAEYLRQQVELSLRKLKVDRLDLLQLHRIDPKVSTDEQFSALAGLQADGKVAALGLSEVSVAEIKEASTYFTVSTVQNRYNLTDTSSEDVLDYCAEQGIGFIPWAPISAGELAQPGGPVAVAAERLGATPSQVALAWLLKRSPVMVPIPGTGSISHLEDNMGAAEVELDDDTFAEIQAAAH